MDLVLSVSQMAAMDHNVIQELGLPGVCLMENAGRGAAEALLDEVDKREAESVAILCGGGNNGGDGYVIARHLLNQGLDPKVFALAPAVKLKGDAATNRRVLENMGLAVVDLDDDSDLPDFREFDLIVDALLGTGLKGAAQGVYARMIGAVTDSMTPVIAIDIPSGVQGDSGKVEGPAIMAERTLTMACVKRGLLLPPGVDYTGEVDVIDIGYDPGVMISGEEWLCLSQEEVHSMLPGRRQSSHKGDYGKVLLIAGAEGMLGAAALAAASVLRAGAGMVRVAIPGELCHALSGLVPEAMTLPGLSATPDGTLAYENLDALRKAIEWADVLAIGPGMGRHAETQQLVRELVLESPLPVVLDADGLFAFNGKPESLADGHSPIVVTPHHGEFQRLFGRGGSDLVNMTELAISFAADTGVTVLLKGAPSITAATSGEVLVNTTGNHGMSTAGSGDVLTGLLAGLSAQGIDMDIATACAAWIHGLAGDLASVRLGPRGMTAGDIRDHLPLAFKYIEGEHDHEEDSHEHA